jgi:voltage-gated potassium channel
MMEFGSLGLLGLESPSPDANIVNASDAMWYVIVTMSTVGYGDQYPVTNGGRELGSVIIIVGVGIFGTLTGYLANLFLAPRTAQDAQEKLDTLEDPDRAQPDQSADPAAAPATAPSEVERQLTQLRAALSSQQAALDALERSLRAG